MSFSTTTLANSYSLNANGTMIVGGTIATSGGTATFSGGESLGGFKSGSISFDASSIDNSTRGDGGWAKNAPGARSATIDLTWNKLETDAGQVGLMGLLTQSQEDWSENGVAIKYTSTNGTDTSGFFGVFVPTSYSENQTGGGDADGTAVECSMTLASYGEIYPV